MTMYLLLKCSAQKRGSHIQTININKLLVGCWLVVSGTFSLTVRRATFGGHNRGILLPTHRRQRLRAVIVSGASVSKHLGLVPTQRRFRSLDFNGLADGEGSDPFHPMVRIAITVLDMVVDMLGATSMLDAACGDAAWIATAFLSRRPQVKYTGVDIVSHVIEDIAGESIEDDENQRRFPSLRFLTADLSGTSLPAADFVFSKETLNHMFLKDAVQALSAFRASGNRYLVTNIHRGAPNNQGATKGHHAHYAPYDYTLHPFNLRKLCPLLAINEEDRNRDVFLMLEVREV
eukprot:s353_g12.t1